jgi:hypothetical protein
MSGRIVGARVGGQQKAEDKGEQQRVSPDIGRLFNGGNQTMSSDDEALRETMKRLEREAAAAADSKIAADRRAFEASPVGRFIALAALVALGLIAWSAISSGGESDAERDARRAQEASCKAGTLADCPAHVMVRARRIADAIDDGAVTRSQLRRMAECETRWSTDAAARVICADQVLSD